MQWHEFRTHIRHLPAKDLGRLERAFALGKKMHGDQKRFSGDPYFNHPIAVAMMLSDLGADADTLIASLLHDTVEDTPISIAEIDHQFDGSVGTLIDGLTKLNSEDVAMSPNLNEQVETLRKIFTLMQSDIRIMVIKLIDRLHNMQTIEFLPPERQRLLAEETAEVFVKIADRLCMRDIRDELGALCLSVLEPELYEKLKNVRIGNEQRGMPIVEKIRQNFQSFDPELATHTKIFFANKSWGQLRVQSEAPASTGRSFVTVIFICNDVDSCYRTLGVLHQMWKRETLSFEDFVNVPQLNGYRGIHTTIIAPDGTRVRCKIRTREMQEYSRLGVSSVCFKGPTDIGEILPWTKRISPLAVDTEGSSNDFWQNLKSDILGEAITVHGRDDTTVQLPNNATALDGVFHLFQENALRTKAVRVNGQEVPLSTVLAKGASLDLELADEETCTLDWLHCVHTGFSTAKIRSFLAQQSEEKKLETGQKILQKIFAEQKRGYLEEFDETVFARQLAELGYHSLRDIYIAIADGRLEPTMVYTAFFQPAHRKRRENLHSSIIRYKIAMNNTETMDRANLAHRKHGSTLTDIRYRRGPNNQGTVSLTVQMSPGELNAFREDLLLAGAEQLVIIPQRSSTVFLIGAIVLLWGLDPVVARQLLLGGYLLPVDLTIIRFVTFFLAASTTYAVYELLSPVKSKALWPLQSSLVFSGVALFLTALFSYITLSLLPATQYILFIIAGLVLTHFLQKALETDVSRRFILSASALAGAIALLIALQGFSLMGTLAGLGSALGFAVYSQLSKRYQETDARIYARYPAFVFWLSIITMLLTIGAIFWMPDFRYIPWSITLKAGLFAFVFCFLPYALYFDCMHKTDITILERLLPFVCIATILGELALTRSLSALAAIPLLAVFLWFYYPREQRES